MLGGDDTGGVNRFLGPVCTKTQRWDEMRHVWIRQLSWKKASTARRDKEDRETAMG